MQKNKIQIYDTTLRDGSQMHGISFSVADKIKIVQILDELGVDYIEGGWPGANPKDGEFFEQAEKLKLKNSKLAAFGSTRRIDSENCDDDIILQGLLKANTPVVTIVAKSWDMHVEEALRTTLEKNLLAIKDSVEYLKSKGKEVFLDAEHFFDGYLANPEYSFQVVETSLKAGVDGVILCDTNGGTYTSDIKEIVTKLKEKFPKANFGIHTHNDCGLAVANSLAAVEAGAIQIQGTINGYGERCGNADLIQIIPNLVFKLNKQCLNSAEDTHKLTATSHIVSEIANLNPSPNQPFTGRFAFTHKGGLHVSAMRRNSRTYEHIKPEMVGNKSRIVVSEQSGVSNILDFAKSKGIDIGENPERMAKEALLEIKQKEHEGFQFEQSGASLELLLLKKLDKRTKFFEVIDFRVFASYDSVAEATVQIRVGDTTLHTASLGVGPGHALDNALRKALGSYYETIKSFKLTDFKVRVVDGHDGTSAKTRVNAETSDLNGRKWNTIGLHENILQATFQAISESIEYGLYINRQESKN
jgi:2-isopropylmalate synthase